MPTQNPPRTLLRRRSRVLIVSLFVAAALSVGGLVASADFKSPAQIAAETAPPNPSILSAPVVRQVLSLTVVMRAIVEDQTEYRVTPKSEVGASYLVVTSISKSAGSKLSSGDVIGSISGRPLFVLQGPIPAYRNLAPGDEGPDVAELQMALRNLGYMTGGDRLGSFGYGTKSAVTEFYNHINYPPAFVSQTAAMQTSETAVIDAGRTLASLRLELKALTANSNNYVASPSSEIGASTLVITSIRKPVGSVVNSGDVVASVSGRPLFILQGAVPAYRNLAPGESGSDVAELQVALSRLGYSIGSDAAGSFGPGTEAAVSHYYQHIGYAPAVAGSEAAIIAAEAAVKADLRNISALQSQLNGGASSAAGSSGNSGAGSLSSQLSTSQQQLSLDEANLNSLQATSGPMVPLAELVFLPHTPAKVVAIAGRVGQAPGAPFVSFAILPAHKKGRVSILNSAARTMGGVGQIALSTATGTSGNSGISVAGGSGAASAGNSGVGNSGSGAAASIPGTGANLSTQIAWASQDLARAQSQLVALQSTSGPMVPLSEVVFLPSFPAHVVSISAPVGSPPKSSFATLTLGTPVLIGQLNPSDAGLIHIGQRATISDPEYNFEGAGVVIRLTRSATSANSDTGAPYFPLTLAPNPAMSESLVGQDVQVTLVAAHTDGPVLTVPVAAVFATANGKTYVTKVESRGFEVRIPVRTGITANGETAISPMSRNTLGPGDRVVTGLANSSGAGNTG